LVLACIETRDHPVREIREKAASDLERELEDLARERMDDRELAASLDGLTGSRMMAYGPTALVVTGAFWTLQANQLQTGQWMLPLEARLSLDPGVASSLRVATRDGLFGLESSEREVQRVLARTTWQPTIDVQVT
jgi:hypothetical protein